MKTETKKLLRSAAFSSAVVASNCRFVPPEGPGIFRVLNEFLKIEYFVF